MTALSVDDQHDGASRVGAAPAPRRPGRRWRGGARAPETVSAQGKAARRPTASGSAWSPRRARALGSPPRATGPAAAAGAAPASRRQTGGQPRARPRPPSARRPTAWPLWPAPAGLAQKANEQEVIRSELLVGYRGCLFNVGPGYEVTVARDPFDAIGSGGEAARGALHASPWRDPVTRMCLALEAGEQFAIGVRCPFTILRQETRLVSPSAEVVECCEIDFGLDERAEPDADSGASSSSAA